MYIHPETIESFADGFCETAAPIGDYYRRVMSALYQAREEMEAIGSLFLSCNESLGDF